MNNNNEPNISLYGEGAAEDFPVLKAFQQYIDAEQAKARRRLLTVSVMFVIILLAVIAIFSVLVIKANNQTQLLNDRLVEFAMKDSDRKVEAAKAAALQENTVKTLSETLEKFQKRIEEQDRKAAEAAATVAKQLAEVKSTAAEPKKDPANDKRMQEAEAKLQKAIALLKAQKDKLNSEKEQLRQKELELYRREQYPEYYAQKESAAKKAKKPIRIEDDDEDLDEDITYFDEDEDEDLEDIPVVAPKKPAKTPSASVKAPAETTKAPAAKKASKASKTDLDDDDAIDYFKDSDSYTIPVEVKGKSAGWRVPLD